MEISNAINYRESIVALLLSEKLLVNDLPPVLDNFLVAMQDDIIIGSVGLEVYGDYGLLRSLVVHRDYREQGIADKLVRQIELQAQSKNLKAIYLLTETAPEYFIRKKYIKITRSNAPPEIQQSAQFSHVCPQSAMVMRKNLI